MDCSKIENYLRELSRMCDHEGCEDCLIDELGYGSCIDTQAKFTAKCIAIVQRWSDEHPPKTYAQDFFEKFPNAPTWDEGHPKACLLLVYGGEAVTGRCESIPCSECWNRPIPEVEK